MIKKLFLLVLSISTFVGALETYYDILHVAKNASRDEIFSGYQQAMLHLSNQETLEKIQEAYGTLINKRKRQAYDQFLQELEEFEVIEKEPIDEGWHSIDDVD